MRILRDENLEILAGRANKSVGQYEKRLLELCEPEVIRARYKSCKNSTEITIAVLKDSGIKEITNFEIKTFAMLKWVK